MYPRLAERVKKGTEEEETESRGGHGERIGSDRKRCGKKKETVTGEDWGGV